MLQGYAKDQPEGFDNYVKNVCIVGAGGQIGSQVTKALLKIGKHKITAVARPGSTTKVAEGVRKVEVDYNDENAVVAAFKGHEALVVTMSTAAEPEIMMKLVRAAAKAGLPYVLPNYFGLDPHNPTVSRLKVLSDFRNKVLSSSREVEALGVSAYMHLVCGYWYEWSLGGGPERYGFDFKKRTFNMIDDGKVPTNTSTWPRCGEAIAKLLCLKLLPENETDKEPTMSQFSNKDIHISSFLVNQSDVFESVKRVTKTTDADWTITSESSEKVWADGLEQLKQGNYKGITKMFHSGVLAEGGGGNYGAIYGLDNDVLGLEQEDLDAFTAVAVSMAENDAVHIEYVEEKKR